MPAILTAPTRDSRNALRRAGNPFRNYFARNPDDDVCSRYHVPELYAAERDLLLAVVDLYRYDPMTHSEVVPILGNKGAGKTHLLHSIKHGAGGPWQLLVTPGVYQKDTDFLEYLLFQIIDTLLGGGKQKGVRPLEYVGDQLARRLLGVALRGLTADEKVELFPPPGIGRWARRLGIGQAQAAERADWLAESLAAAATPGRAPVPLAQALADAGLSPQKAFDLLNAHVQKSEPHNTAGLMRRAVLTGFARAALLNDEAELANFVTYGFAELDFQVRPTRQDLVLALFKVMMDVFRGQKIPVVVAFDQLEDLLLSRRADDAHQIAEAFFAGIVKIMHQIDGLCVLVFAERGLWNRFVPSLDGYIQDRLNNPIHVPKHGTVKAVRLEAPAADLVARVVEARLRPVLAEVPDGLPDGFPFAPDQIARVAATEPTLRDMLQQFRHLFDHVVYGETADDFSAPVPAAANEPEDYDDESAAPEAFTNRTTDLFADVPSAGRIDSLLGKEPAAVSFKSAEVVNLSAAAPPAVKQIPVPTPVSRPDPRPSGVVPAALADLWDQEFRAARRKLEPDGAVTGATRELQAGLGSFLAACHEHGVKVGPWRLSHVVPEYAYGDHPTYGVVTIAHWACQDGQPWKVGVGLFLARGTGKPKDLEIKLGVMDTSPAVVDHLILIRPEDDTTISGKSKQLWAEAERKGRHARLEPASLDTLALAYSFPRWLTAVREALPAGAPLPNLADVIQDKCEKLLEQVCMPVT